MGYLEVIKALPGGAPTHYYPLNSTYQAQDVIGTGTVLNGANVGGVTYTTDARSAAQFGGANYIEIPDHDHFSVGGTRNNGTMTVVSFMTVDQWAKPSAAGSRVRVYWMGKFRQDGEREWTNALYWQPDASEARARRISVYHNNLTPGTGACGVGHYFSPKLETIPAGVDRSTFYNVSTSPSGVDYAEENAGVEMMIVSRFQRSPFFIDIWLNGRQTGHQTSNAIPSCSDSTPITFSAKSGPGTSPLRIGSSQTGGNTWGLIGRVRRVAFFDRVLSSTDINTLYNARTQVETSGSVAQPGTVIAVRGLASARGIAPAVSPTPSVTWEIGGTNTSTSMILGSVGIDSVTPDPDTITPPSAPVLSLTPGPTTITALWSVLSDGGSPVTGYRLALTPASPTEAPRAVDITDPAVTSFTFSGLINGNSYAVTVSARNEVGESSATTALSSPEALGVAPGPVTALTLTPFDQAVRVAFTPPVDSGSSAITGYRVTASALNRPTLSYFSTAEDPTVLGLANGVPYTFSVTAVNAAGDSAPSIGSATPSASVIGQLDADPPQNLVVTPYNGAIRVQWTAPGFMGSQPFSDYLIEVDNGPVYFSTTTGTSAYIGGLSESSDVDVRVYTRTATGPSAAASSLGVVLGNQLVPSGTTFLARYAAAPLSPLSGLNPIFPAGYVPPAEIVASGAPKPPRVFTLAPASFIYAFPAQSLFHPENFGQATAVKIDPAEGG